jgi:hypothetical protein
VALPVGVRRIINVDDLFQKRLEAIHRLGSGLDSREIRALIQFLLERHAEDDLQTGQVVKNDLLDLLCSHEPLLFEMSGVLTRLFRDKTQHIVVRDYALQHMAPFYEHLARGADPGNSTVATAMEGMRQAIRDAMSEADSSLAGTALLAWKHLSPTFAEFSRSELASEAVRLAGENEAGELTRLTAIQVCAHLQIPEANAIAVSLATTGNSVPLRISAIGALGVLGTQAELGLLEGLATQGHERLKRAARSALRALIDRLNRPGRLH